MKEQFDIAQGLICLATFAGAAYVIPKAWVRTKAFYKDRFGDKTAYNAARAAFHTPESDEQLRKATKELTEQATEERQSSGASASGAIRTPDTDKHLTGRGPKSGVDPSGGRSPE